MGLIPALVGLMPGSHPTYRRSARQLTAPRLGPIARANPESAYIEITSRCNLRCAMCPRTHFGAGHGADRGLGDLEEVLRQLPGVSRAVLHGLGEPLLNPRLPDMILQLK